MTTQAAPQAPPFCPNPECVFHLKPAGWQYDLDGVFYRKNAPHCVQRYRCCSSGRHFSEQTFRTTCWLKRPKLLAKVFHGLLSCSCLCQIARAEGAPSPARTRTTSYGFTDSELRRSGRMTQSLELRVKDMLKRRLSATRGKLPKRWDQYCHGKVVTRLMPKGRDHRLRYAF